MLVCCSKRTIHLFGELNPYADQATLRYRAFRSFDWDVSYFDQEEWEEDEYDIPPTTLYFVYYNKTGQALGCCRLVHTDLTYTLAGAKKSFMLKDVFSDSTSPQKNLLFFKQDLPTGKNVLEGTRFAIAPHLLAPEHKLTRQLVISELTLGVIHHALRSGVHSVVGIMPVKVWDSVWRNRGCPPTWIGPEVKLENEESVRAGNLRVSEKTLADMHASTGLSKIVIHYGEDKHDTCTVQDAAPKFARAGQR